MTLRKLRMAVEALKKAQAELDAWCACREANVSTGAGDVEGYRRFEKWLKQFHKRSYRVRDIKLRVINVACETIEKSPSTGHQHS